ncbi:PadR family transcriptional regulator [Micromonospora sp. CPCC 206061]|uniref:PadR family transcriptional regulator n=1 Tax=Micromonospora sp. CPCC 206061 TaxID=3122410 RepID=UPI002FF13198
MVSLKMTMQTRTVLRALLSAPGQEVYGLEIVEATGLPPGTIYPILARLESAGWIESRWEDVDQHAVGRPRRRYYRFVAGPVDGAAAARLALAEADERQRARQRRRTPNGEAVAW